MNLYPLYRISGNWLTGFVGPLIGINLVGSPDAITSVLTALVASTLVTALAIGRELEKKGKKPNV